MAYKSLSIFSLYLTGVWASRDACLSPDASGQANKASCCAGSGHGQAVVGDILYEYTCNSYADRYSHSVSGTISAYDCASACSKDIKCHASSWQPTSGGGSCWLSSAGFKLTPDPYNLWVVLVNTERAGHVVDPAPAPTPEPTPEPVSCDEDIQTARNQCTTEKDQLTQRLDQECQTKVTTEINTCQQTAANKCENEKILLEQKLKAEYDEKLAALTPAPPTSSVMALDAGTGECEGHEAGSVFTFNGIKYRTFSKRNIFVGNPANFRMITKESTSAQSALEICSQNGDKGCGVVQTCHVHPRGIVTGGWDFVTTHRDMNNKDFIDNNYCCLFVRV